MEVKTGQMDLFDQAEEINSGIEEMATKVKEVQQEDTSEGETQEEGLIRGEWTKEEWTSPVIEGGPTRQEVEEWKDKHGNVYFLPFESEILIFRTLTRSEYREIIRNTDINMLDREELIADKCVLFPRNFSCVTYGEKGRAGVPSILSEMIMDKSGFVAQSAPIKL